jgi:NAD(P)-dependent dehydrogenase (short-subunit alcohol dehydrogenase family)
VAAEAFYAWLPTRERLALRVNQAVEEATMSRLQNKVALITGGTSGIGLAATQRFVAEGAFVYIFARRQGELDKTVASIGRSIAGVQGDVRKLEDLDRL